jgi:antitoxin (DNA-binding transcriptional repressor) of toxin-antitoxin stability system
MTMQTTLAVEDITLTLPELLDSLAPGDQVILTRNHQPVAKLVSEASKTLQPRKAGNWGSKTGARLVLAGGPETGARLGGRKPRRDWYWQKSSVPSAEDVIDRQAN